MNEQFLPLDKITLDRLSEEWDRRSGKGPFSLTAEVAKRPSGRPIDVITITEGEDRQLVEEIIREKS